jgi:large subunit ribosomal protein L6
MSRIGKRAIEIPSGVEFTVSENEIMVKGKGGTLTRSLHHAIKVAVDGKEVTVSPVGNSRTARALWGTYAAHIRNMIMGVMTPFVKKLQIEGIGYKAEVQPARPGEPGHSGGGKNLKLALGFSHPVIVPIPQGITTLVEKNIITISGADKEQVGQFAASVRALKKPEPYKGKGIRYEGERVREKAGKKAAGAAA